MQNWNAKIYSQANALLAELYYTCFIGLSNQKNNSPNFEFNFIGLPIVICCNSIVVAGAAHASLITGMSVQSLPAKL